MGSEMCIRDSYGMQMMSNGLESVAGNKMKDILEKLTSNRFLGIIVGALITACLLYTSDAADEEDSVDFGGRRIIEKKNKKNYKKLLT